MLALEVRRYDHLDPLEALQGATRQLRAREALDRVARHHRGASGASPSSAYERGADEHGDYVSLRVLGGTSVIAALAAELLGLAIPHTTHWAGPGPPPDRVLVERFDPASADTEPAATPEEAAEALRPFGHHGPYLSLGGGLFATVLYGDTAPPLRYAYTGGDSYHVTFVDRLPEGEPTDATSDTRGTILG